MKMRDITKGYKFKYAGNIYTMIGIKRERRPTLGMVDVAIVADEDGKSVKFIRCISSEVQEVT